MALRPDQRVGDAPSGASIPRTPGGGNRVRPRIPNPAFGVQCRRRCFGQVSAPRLGGAPDRGRPPAAHPQNEGRAGERRVADILGDIMERAPRAMLAIAMAIALTATASGCGLSLFFPVVEESTPIPEDVDASLEPYYSQVLRWDQCGEFLCTTARAPLDWDDPSAEEIELALIRQPAEEDKVGSLLVNPGGPGVSGYDFVAESVDVAVTEAVQDRYDIVGFDPRGVGRSTAVECLEPAELDSLLYGIPPGSRGSNSWITGAERAHALIRAGVPGEHRRAARQRRHRERRPRPRPAPRRPRRGAARLPRVLVRRVPRHRLRRDLSRQGGAAGARRRDRPGPQRTPDHPRPGAGPRDGAPLVPRGVHPGGDLPVPGIARRGDGDGARASSMRSRRIRSRRPTAARSVRTPS